MILTSNQSFAAWAKSSRPGHRHAILDRLLHHAVHINIRGNPTAQREVEGRPGAYEETEG